MDQRKIIATMGGKGLRAKHDPREYTKPARAGFRAKLRAEVEAEEPGLDEAEIAARVEAKFDLHMLGMRLKAAKTKEAKTKAAREYADSVRARSMEQRAEP